jgi:L-threonylcarbamoyladenylate synthase
MKLLKANDENIEFAAKVILEGGLVALPTETVYGLGANGLDPLAVARIFEAKQRPAFNPLILHISNFEQLDTIAAVDHEKVDNLIKRFWPGPLTIVLKKKEAVPDIVTAGNDTVAVRMPDNNIALSLINKAGRPIAAPSANAFGFLSPTSAEHVVNQLGEKVDVILDGGQCSIGVESTIIQAADERFYLLRPGGLPAESIEEILGSKLWHKTDEVNPSSPGQLRYHYAPKIPIKFIDEVDLEKYKEKKTGALLFQKNKYSFEFNSVEYLSLKGNFREAAANLFSSLHKMESQDLDIILAEKVEETGLGKAIMDRLRKAANRYA